ncbi:MAG: GNAT family N-acetyltransferase [Bacteroidota bacterium]
MDLNIRKAKSSDMKSVLELIQELATFEKQPAAVEITEQTLIQDGFGEKPAFEVLLAESEDEIIGMALFYPRYSTWKGKALHLEDLIIKNKFRGKGVGTALYRKVMEYAYNNGLKRVAWEVLDWNTPAIEFYESTGARVFSEWRVAQIDEKALENYVKK